MSIDQLCYPAIKHNTAIVARVSARYKNHSEKDDGIERMLHDVWFTTVVLHNLSENGMISLTVVLRRQDGATNGQPSQIPVKGVINASIGPTVTSPSRFKDR